MNEFESCIQGHAYLSLDDIARTVDLMEDDILFRQIVRLTTPSLKELMMAVARSLHLEYPPGLEDHRTEICRFTVQELLHTIPSEELRDLIKLFPSRKRQRVQPSVTFSQCLEAPPQCPDGFSAVPLPEPCNDPSLSRYICARGQPRLFDAQTYRDHVQNYMDYFESEEYIQAFNDISHSLDDFDVNMYYSAQKQKIDSSGMPNKPRYDAILALTRDVPRIADLFAQAKRHAYYRMTTLGDTWVVWDIKLWKVVKHPHQANAVAYQNTQTGSIQLFVPAQSPWILRPGIVWDDWMVKLSIVPNVLWFMNLVTQEKTFEVPASCPFFNPKTGADKLKIGTFVNPWVKQYSVSNQRPYYFNIKTNQQTYDTPEGFS